MRSRAGPRNEASLYNEFQFCNCLLGIMVTLYINTIIMVYTHGCFRPNLLSLSWASYLFSASTLKFATVDQGTHILTCRSNRLDLRASYTNWFSWSTYSARLEGWGALSLSETTPQRCARSCKINERVVSVSRHGGDGS